MEDVETAPYWLESKIFIAAGLTKSQTTMPSLHVDKQGVSEIGLRSFLRFSIYVHT